MQMARQPTRWVTTVALLTLALGAGLLVASPVMAEPAQRSISGVVFFDHVGRGHFEATASPLEGVTVQLSRNGLHGGRRSLETTTDADGSYSFVGLPPGVYTVTYAGLDGYLPTTPDTASVSIVRNSGRVIVDFGLALPVSFFGNVFDDTDCDGQRHFSKAGIAELAVTIFADVSDGQWNPDAPMIAATQTDLRGNYLFNDLLPGDILVAVTVPDGYVSTSPNPVPLTLVSHEAAGAIEVNFALAPDERCQN